MYNELLISHYRLAFTKVLLHLDLALLFLVGLDCLNCWRLGISFRALANPNFALWSPSLFVSLGSFIALIVVVIPLALAVAKVVGFPGLSRVTPATKPGRIVVGHIAACVVFAAAVLCADHLQIASGWLQRDPDAFVTEYRSLVYALVTSPFVGRTVTALVSLVGVAATGLVGYVLVGAQDNKIIKQYAVRACLADLPVDFRPAHAPFRSAMTAEEVRRELPFVNRFADKLNEMYFKDLRLRSDRLNYAKQLLDETKQIMREQVFDVPGGSPGMAPIRGPEFFSDLSMAWDYALSSSGVLGTVLISPFCSPRTMGIVRSRCTATDARVIVLPRDGFDLYGNWDSQLETLHSGISALLRQRGDPATLVIPHVWHASGRRFCLSRIIAQLRNEYPSPNVKIVVDGTNAVGNNSRIPTDSGWNSYVFYPHRWLFATIACAAVIDRADTEIREIGSGCLGGVGRSYDDVFYIIAGIRAGAEVIRTRGIESFWNRCKQLRENAIDGLPKALRIVGSPSDAESTFIFAAYPSGRNSWRRDLASLNDSIGKISAAASLVTIDADRPWIRMTLPYYLDPREINRVNGFLDDNVSD